MADLYLKKNTNNKRGCRSRLFVIGTIILALIIIFLLVKRSKQRGRSRVSASEVTVSEPVGLSENRFEKELGATKPKKLEKKDLSYLEDDKTSRLYDEGRALLDSGDLLGARNKFIAVLKNSYDKNVQKSAEELLGKIHTKLVFSQHPMPEKVDYVIVGGDSLSTLAQKFNTTIEMIRKGNNVSGHLIRVGDNLRILNAPFSIIIDKSDNDLVLMLGNKFFKRYRVGTGKYNSTPTGSYKITDRIVQPVWWRPDGKCLPYGHPENLLGTHWLSINARGYGIHGTWEPNSIGKQTSSGCVRLLNEDIEELYTLVPVGTAVEIKE